jgi:dCTP deaminase
MVLVDQDILNAIKVKDIEITPFDRKRLGSNSYDLTLGPTLFHYSSAVFLDCKKEPIHYATINLTEVGFLLMPDELYLGNTNEYTVAKTTVPCIEGKSSIGRLGISIHATAGFGDVGFAGTWTLEISCIVPVRIYPNMPIAQIYFHLTQGKCQVPYHRKDDSKYKSQSGAPVISAMWKNFI